MITVTTTINATGPHAQHPVQNIGLKITAITYKHTKSIVEIINATNAGSITPIKNANAIIGKINLIESTIIIILIIKNANKS